MDGRWNRLITNSEAARLVADINQRGYAVLSNYVSEKELEPARTLARTAVAASGGEYVCFAGTDALAGTVLGELPRSAAFKNLCQRLYELGTGKTAPEVSFYQIFRCLQGTTGRSNSYLFHYDSYVLTALLPVAIPETGLPGDLLVFPNTRGVRRRYLTNVLDKVLVDNKVTQIVLRAAARRRLGRMTSIKMQPGNMYFFWGYRSIHTNQPCDPDKLRATALFHYADPHQNSRTRALIRRVREPN